CVPVMVGLTAKTLCFDQNLCSQSGTGASNPIITCTIQSSATATAGQVLARIDPPIPHGIVSQVTGAGSPGGSYLALSDPNGQVQYFLPAIVAVITFTDDDAGQNIPQFTDKFNSIW